MNKQVPNFLKELLTKDYGEEITEKIIKGYTENRKVTLRINTLKTDTNVIKQELEKERIKYKEVEWSEQALILENAIEDQIRNLNMYKNGEIYLQSLSSMLPPIILNPKPEENILDMTAAPGGKTTEIAALSNNEAMITACEKNKIRLERLKYNIEKQGARVTVIEQDSRRLDEYFSFDKILLDAPCSGSGTENIYEEKFSKVLIERSVKTQEELIKKAIQILKINGELTYSTCSILKQENEEIINKILKTGKVEIVKIEPPKRSGSVTS